MDRDQEAEREEIAGEEGFGHGGEKNEYLKEVEFVLPHSCLPLPEPPAGLAKERSIGPDEERLPIGRSASLNSAVEFIRDRSSVFSAAIVRRFSSSSLKEPPLLDGNYDPAAPPATEFHLHGLKVVVRVKGESETEEKTEAERVLGFEIKGRVSFFSRSGCRDCGGVRSFFRERGIPYVEINLDVFPERALELVERTGSAAVPAIFFNEKLLGGLVALNSLRNSGEFDRRLREMASRRCPDTAPRIPVYGFDDEEELEGERPDAMVAVARVLRQRLPIQDRITRMKLVKNCFTGGDAVEALIGHLDCGRKKAIEIGKELARKHFIHHVFRENAFEDGRNHFYRFLEHEPSIPRCFNFRGTTNDNEPKPIQTVGHKLTKLMQAILESYASNDRRHLDYGRIAASEEFRRYVNLIRDLQRIDIFSLSAAETLTFFLNLYNAMVIDAIIKIGRPGMIDRKAFYTDFQYIIGGFPYSLSSIKNGILRSNRRQPYSLVKPFSAGDKRLELVPDKVNPLIHFGLSDGTRSSPTVRFFSAQDVEVELRYAAREFFLHGGVEVDLEKRIVHLNKIFKWYSTDFGQEKDILKLILTYLDATKAGLLTHLLNDGGPIKISYQNFDWSLNC
ncbi:uncharacterized protein LOC122025153 [Zingiber officinale]|uniref:DEP domain-containing protein n=1 Tax=Zingiber officinale TaxID=94328 RepID=A0A8J5KDA1_ZINOF|nr:uncharacterized protein LOC122025153 [Zingiber officinale]KAG6476373.1 hypothetical protein ZIOFF_065613 [Zingiber officinale]